MEGPSVETALAELRRARDEAQAVGATDRAVLLHLVVIIEELSETVGELHERVTRIERRLSGSHPQPGR
jgi:hypothetical protein